MTNFSGLASGLGLPGRRKGSKKDPMLTIKIDTVNKEVIEGTDIDNLDYAIDTVNWLIENVEDFGALTVSETDTLRQIIAKFMDGIKLTIYYKEGDNAIQFVIKKDSRGKINTINHDLQNFKLFVNEEEIESLPYILAENDIVDITFDTASSEGIINIIGFNFPSRVSYINGAQYQDFETFPPGVIQHYDANYLISDNDGFIEKVIDLSGNDFHLTQLMHASKPSIKLNAINGYQSIEFDGINDFMTGLSNITTNELDYIIVYRYVSGAVPCGICSLYNNTTVDDWVGSEIMLAQYNSGGMSSIRGNSSQAPYGDLDTNWNIARLTSKPSGRTTQLNANTIRNHSSIGDNFNINKISLGSRFASGVNSFFTKVEIVKILIYDRVLTQEEKDLTYNILNTKYNVF